MRQQTVLIAGATGKIPPLDGAAVQVLRGATVVKGAPLTRAPPDGEGRIRHLAGLPVGTLDPGAQPCA